MTYKNIYDIPAYLYYEISKSSDYSKLSDENISKKELAKVWDSIITEKYNVFGLSKEEHEIIVRRKEIKILECDIILEKNLSLKAIKRGLEIELQNYINSLSSGVEQSFGEQCSEITKFMGLRIHPRTITLYEFLNDRNILIKENGRNKA